MEQLSDIGEDELIRRIVEQLPSSGNNVIVGPGDDCAVVDVFREGYYQLLKTDAVVEGVHYLATACPREVGWKAIARVVSDFAAMGGGASQILVTIALPDHTAVEYVEELYRGMSDCASMQGVVISGGETTTSPEGAGGMISVSGTGWVKKNALVTRSGGKSGDLVIVTGTLGGSITGKHLTFTPRVKEASWLTKNFILSSMMDLSDGVAKDLPRLAKASHCGFHIEGDNVPCNIGCSLSEALGDGEDYELLFTLSEAQWEGVITAWTVQFPDLPLTVIGRLEDEGHYVGLEGAGWEHFRSI